MRLSGTHRRRSLSREGSLCCDDIDARPPRRRRLRFSLNRPADCRPCSGRSRWSGSRSRSSPGCGRTPCTICRYAGSRPASRFSAAKPGCRSRTRWLAYSPKDPYVRAFIVGIVNTLRVAVIGIVLATVIGTLVGIARLSSNWLLSRLAAVYVETAARHSPAAAILFWYVLMQGLPAARAAWKPIEGVFLSNRGPGAAVRPARGQRTSG